MKRLLRMGSLIWTACSAGWFVLGYVTGLTQAYMTGVGCLAVAALFYNMGGDYK